MGPPLGLMTSDHVAVAEVAEASTQDGALAGMDGPVWIDMRDGHDVPVNQAGFAVIATD